MPVFLFTSCAVPVCCEYSGSTDAYYWVAACIYSQACSVCLATMTFQLIFGISRVMPAFLADTRERSVDFSWFWNFKARYSGFKPSLENQSWPSRGWMLTTPSSWSLRDGSQGGGREVGGWRQTVDLVGFCKHCDIRGDRLLTVWVRTQESSN